MWGTPPPPPSPSPPHPVMQRPDGLAAVLTRMFVSTAFWTTSLNVVMAAVSLTRLQGNQPEHWNGSTRPATRCTITEQQSVQCTHSTAHTTEIRSTDQKCQCSISTAKP
jgi:hypothetical protein